MDDAALVSGIERLDDLTSHGQHFFDRQHTSAGHAIGECATLDEFEDEGADTLVFLDAVNRRDARMVQRGEHLCLALEAGQPIRVPRERERQHLERDVPVETRVAGTVDLAHATRPQRRDDLVGTETGTRGQRHELAIITSVVSLLYWDNGEGASTAAAAWDRRGSAPPSTRPRATSTNTPEA